MTTLLQRSRRAPALVKAQAHQFGESKGKVTRAFFGVSESDERWIEEELDRRIDLNIQRDGSRG